MSIKQHIQDIRYGALERRKKWLIFGTVIMLVVILLLWIFVFGVQTTISERTVSEAGRDGSLVEFWGAFKDSIQYAEQAFSASMGLIQNINVEQAATTTPSASPTSTVVELH
ncbi:hypothetical protein A2755_03250 [Candidatus Wolfebacteria bacterium RIFCSPHIGHO2_01_FULL_48_22]|uniref:Uncharacterized protein n=2 Tax=Candidatus Wolfeibacteriota TaxID=1752735 RepID=A0A1F8DPJ6_9BACT|nr:MAG: hypothetical protein A2755_03250 [Candidatus Wolfebacteria bacterium RIFCSPHIGHO2_01_FULL_48_22]OGM92046.1 MAG: hypothetical protein A2935_01740 [Candidatus Wolfebacteria bacterium RIFCSPLOWO2_01_FULL_47_17b]